MKVFRTAGLMAVFFMAATGALQAGVVEGQILEVRQEVSQVLVQDRHTGSRETVNVTSTTQFIGADGLGYLVIGDTLRAEGNQDFVFGGLTASTVEVVRDEDLQKDFFNPM